MYPAVILKVEILHSFKKFYSSQKCFGLRIMKKGQCYICVFRETISRFLIESWVFGI